MACWSAENATKAYLQTIKLGMNAKEPNVGEFISAFAAGNNAQLMVIVCAATAAGCTTVGLIAAAYLTGGRVICIVRGSSELNSSIEALGCNASRVEFVIGEAQTLLSTKYTNADLVVIDCNIENHEGIFRAVEVLTTRGEAINNKIVLGYNAFFCKDLSRCGGSKTQYLPIGEGLLIRRISANCEENKKRSHWIIKVDECTGEEHVFRITSPRRRALHSLQCDTS